jgi:hypothetical protein
MARRRDEIDQLIENLQNVAVQAGAALRAKKAELQALDDEHAKARAPLAREVESMQARLLALVTPDAVESVARPMSTATDETSPRHGAHNGRSLQFLDGLKKLGHPGNVRAIAEAAGHPVDRDSLNRLTAVGHHLISKGAIKRVSNGVFALPEDNTPPPAEPEGYSPRVGSQMAIVLNELDRASRNENWKKKLLSLDQVMERGNFKRAQRNAVATTLSVLKKKGLAISPERGFYAHHSVRPSAPRLEQQANAAGLKLDVAALQKTGFKIREAEQSSIAA